MKQRFVRCTIHGILAMSMFFMAFLWGCIHDGNAAAAVLISQEEWQANSAGFLREAPRELLDELAERGLAEPVYADDLQQCIDTDLLYFLPDGYVYSYMQRLGGLRVRNELLHATDAEGRLYNLGMGYADDTRYSTSSQAEKNAAGWDVTGYIEASPGAILRLRNIDFFSDEEIVRSAFIFFDSEYNYVTSSEAYSCAEAMSSAWSAVTDETGELMQCIIPESYSSDIAYVRMIAKDIREDSCITVNQAIDYAEYVGGWYRIAFLPGEEFLQEKMRQEAEKAQTYPESAEKLPDYWQEHLAEKSDEVRKIMETVGRKKAAFLWYTDSHWNYNFRYSPELLKYLYNHTPINKTMFGGDIVLNEPTSETIDDRTIMAYLWDWRSAIRDLPHHHSVVGNHDDGNTADGILSSEYVYSYLMAPEECSEIVRGGDFYYYIDDPNEMTRYLYLDTAYKNILYDEAQQEWVREALKTAPEDWHIIAIAHIWVSVDYAQNPPIPTGFSDAGQMLLNIFDAYNSRQGEYAECGAKVEFCIGGHSHVDAVYRSESGIPVITTETDSRIVRGSFTDETGTVNENSVNAVIADYANNTIHILRIGRGENMTIEY